jgi:hypothetical protein
VGVGEWEPIKIHRWNLAYVPKLTRHTSLLTRPRHVAIDKLLASRTGLVK